MSDYISKLVPRSAHRKTNTNPEFLEFLEFLSRNVLSIQLLKYCYLHLLMYSIKTDLQTCNLWTGQSFLKLQVRNVVSIEIAHKNKKTNTFS